MLFQVLKHTSTFAYIYNMRCHQTNIYSGNLNWLIYRLDNHSISSLIPNENSLLGLLDLNQLTICLLMIGSQSQVNPLRVSLIIKKTKSLLRNQWLKMNYFMMMF